MMNKCFNDRSGRKIIVTGHYGSGKTEFSVSLALLLAGHNSNPIDRKIFSSISIVDLDIVNPYFRSRERRELLENSGISVYGSVFEKETAAELPALGASIRTPLENRSCRVIIDTGGNDTGALVLNQFTKYFTDDETIVLTVINANRPDTSDIEGILKHIKAIEKTTKLNITGLVNNTHMLRDTTCTDIINGHSLCKKVYEMTGKELIYNCYPEGIINPDELEGIMEDLMPLGLYMRPTWLDK